ncbi:cell division protein ZipA C-terminal FtsZ-binding domain-containing protein [Psychromonas aquatilis]
MFNVAAKRDNRLGGHESLQFFLTSGFRYCDMNIFHRHENSDGTG